MTGKRLVGGDSSVEATRQSCSVCLVAGGRFGNRGRGKRSVTKNSKRDRRGLTLGERQSHGKGIRRC